MEYGCGKKGHIKADCRSKSDGKEGDWKDKKGKKDKAYEAKDDFAFPTVDTALPANN